MIPPTAAPLWKRTLGWIRSHPIATVGLVLALWLTAEAASLPWFETAALVRKNPEDTALMRQRIEEARRNGASLRIQHRWIPYSRIPRHVIDLIVVAEDGTFWTHSGFDWFEVKESFDRNVATRRFARGASTITQQLAKNLYLSTSKSPLRKLREAAITLMLEHHLSKQRILEIYLNCIEWGRGIFGIEAAARRFFGKSASALTFDEAARLAAVIPSPLRHRPDGESRYVVRRKAIMEKRYRALKTGSPLPPEDEQAPTLDPDEETADTAATLTPPDTLTAERNVPNDP